MGTRETWEGDYTRAWTTFSCLVADRTRSGLQSARAGQRTGIGKGKNRAGAWEGHGHGHGHEVPHADPTRPSPHVSRPHPQPRPPIAPPSTALHTPLRTDLAVALLGDLDAASGLLLLLLRSSGWGFWHLAVVERVVEGWWTCTANVPTPSIGALSAGQTSRGAFFGGSAYFADVNAPWPVRSTLIRSSSWPSFSAGLIVAVVSGLVFFGCERSQWGETVPPSACQNTDPQDPRNSARLEVVPSPSCFALP